MDDGIQLCFVVVQEDCCWIIDDVSTRTVQGSVEPGGNILGRGE